MEAVGARSHASSRRRPRALGRLEDALVPAIAFALVLSMTLFGFVKVSRAEERATATAFETAARDRFGAVQREFEASQSVVRSVGSLFDASESVSDAEFEVFVSRMLARHQSIAGVSWVPRITHANRPAHEAGAQERHPGYRITERLQQGHMVRRRTADAYYPVRFLAPLRGNEAAAGFDVGSDPLRHAALLQAGASGKVTATAPIRLVQEEHSSRSFLLFRPLYAGGRIPDTEAERNARFEGVVSAVFRADDLVRRSLDSLASSGLDFKITDVTLPSGEAVLARHRSRMRTAPPGDTSQDTSARRTEATLTLAGRELRFDFSAAPGFYGSSMRPAALALLVMGTLLGAVIFAILFTLQRSDRRAKTDAKRLQQMSQRLIHTQESERHHLARELHDQFGQDLTALRINLHMATRPHDVEEEGHVVSESNAIIDRVLEKVRTISLDLRPAVLDDLGLEPALHSYLKREARRSGLELRFESDPEIGRLPEDVETAVFRFSQEAVTNVLRHARATTLFASLRRRRTELEVHIRDDGVGFDTTLTGSADESHSGGLLGMRERLHLVGGSMTIRSAPGSGVDVEAVIPLV